MNPRSLRFARHALSHSRPSSSTATPPRIPHLLTLADLTVPQIHSLLARAVAFKHLSNFPLSIQQPLLRSTIALLFSKRSTRTRVASESAVALLGGHPMFLGAQDIQLGVNETLADTAKVLGGMVSGVMARVNGHEEVEALAANSPVPVINALSDLYHPTQILADILTMIETYTSFALEEMPPAPKGKRFSSILDHLNRTEAFMGCLKGKKVAWVGDTNNIINEMLVTLPRLGMKVAVASPKGYDKVDERVWGRVVEAGTMGITLTNSPEEALHEADIVVTDTWISMGQETEKAARLDAFKGYQITTSMVQNAGANPDWKFMHCLPRKQEEVDDDVFYGPRSLVFPEAWNRKWTILSCFDEIFGCVGKLNK